MADAFSRLLTEMGLPNALNIGNSDSGLYTLQDLIVSVFVKYWLKVVVPRLVLADCIEEIKTVLSSGYSVVSPACKR